MREFTFRMLGLEGFTKSSRNKLYNGKSTSLQGQRWGSLSRFISLSMKFKDYTVKLYFSFHSKSYILIAYLLQIWFIMWTE